MFSATAVCKGTYTATRNIQRTLGFLAKEKTTVFLNLHTSCLVKKKKKFPFLLLVILKLMMEISFPFPESQQERGLLGESGWFSEVNRNLLALTGVQPPKLHEGCSHPTAVLAGTALPCQPRGAVLTRAAAGP